jgi:MEMO1 family protein
MIREPAVSGTFYPGNPRALTGDIEEYLSRASVEAIEGDILGLISPHAGYMYSGPVAAHGYKALLGRTYDTVIILAPSHRQYFEGAAVQRHGGYKTPLGVVPVNEPFASKLLARLPAVQANDKAHEGEHSLEVQIPFLQFVLKEFQLLPLIMGAYDTDTCEELASALFDVMKDIKDKRHRYLVVGSTDLSHYYPYRHAVELDSKIVERLNAFDVKGLIDDLEEDKCEACGSGPVITTMLLSRKMGANASRVVKYANSGDTSGDKGAVVGYVSCVFYRTGDRCGD